MDINLAVIGAGIQAITLGSGIRKARDLDWLMIDLKPPGENWFKTTVRQGMTRLRSSYGRGRHVDYGNNDGLLRYAYSQFLPSNAAIPINPDDQPKLSDFNGHVRKVIADNSLKERWINAEVLSVDKVGDRFLIKTSSPNPKASSISAKHVVVSVGLGQKSVPPGIPEDRQTIFHSDQINVHEFDFAGPICVVGGGMTAATVALSLVKQQYPVTLCLHSMTVSQLEADAAWLPDGELHRQFQLTSQVSERLEMIRAARIGRSITPEKYAELIRESRMGNLRIHSGFNLTEVRANWNSVDIPGLGNFRALICCTGYRADVRKLDFLKPLLPFISVSSEGLPLIDAKLQAYGVPGLYFMGRFSELQSGPFGRNIPGAWWSTERLLNVFKNI